MATTSNDWMKILRDRYNVLCDWLKYSKYGKVNLPYFDENGKTNEQYVMDNGNKLDRHHIDEWDIRALNVKPYLIESQKPENLVWCNQQEHMMLHILIWYAHGKNDVEHGYITLTEKWIKYRPECKPYIERLVNVPLSEPEEFLRQYNSQWLFYQKYDRYKGGAW